MKSKSNMLSLGATLLLVIAAGSGRADDTDIYVNAAVPTDAEPLVMFSLDYRPNLGSTACNGDECDGLIAEGYLPPVGPYTFMDVIRAAFVKVFEPLDGVRVGLMINHNKPYGPTEEEVAVGVPLLTEADCAGPDGEQPFCSNGGYIAIGFQPFLADDSNGAKARFHQFLEDMPLPQGNLSHSYQGKELFFEFFRYLTGQGIYNAHNGYNDFALDPRINLDVETPPIMWDTSIESGANYKSAIPPDASCAKIFTVNLLFQVSNQEDGSDQAIKATIANQGMALKTKGLAQFPDVIEWLNDADLASGVYGVAPDLDGKQNVTSYFIVDPNQINQKTTGYAQAGGTEVPLPLHKDPEDLINLLNDIFRQILSVSTTFVAASVPVNVFNRAEIVDNVYLALFKADPEAKPFWPGNVKKLRVAGLDTGSPSLVDANGNPAVGADGRLSFDALTYWTDPATLPPPDPDAGEVAGRDGRSVPRGGAGQKMPAYPARLPGRRNTDGGRQLFFDDGGSLDHLDADNPTASKLEAALGAIDSNEAEELIAYARGMDLDDLDGDSDTTEQRSWIMADPLHSRPLPINYGAKDGYSAGNPAIYVAVASNDGYMRFLRNTTVGGQQSGEEVWGFMPQAVMDKVKTLRNNAPGIKHPYMVDGAPVAWMNDANSNGTIDAGEDAWLFFGLRRGGRAYYALDVSDPERPELLWKIEKNGDFAELGNTFSNPRVIKVDIGSGEQPAIAFGGGYDLNKDDRSGVGTNDSEGNALYIVDAETGQLIWKAVGVGAAEDDTFVHPALVDSIPSTLSILDSDGNGLHDRLYVGDTGGNVWRADLPGANVADWKLTKLASIGRHWAGAGGKADDRRFFHRPDIVQSADKDGPFEAVVIASGDRPDPLDKGGLATNWIYMIKDRNFKVGTGVDTALDHSSFGDVTNTCLEFGGECTADLTSGWALQLTAEGEKGLATPLTINNVVFFTSYLPPNGSPEGVCSPAEGSGRLYAVSLKDASATTNYDTTDEDLDRFTELDSKGIPAEVVSLPPKSILRPDLKVDQTSAPTRFQTYWFEEEDGDL